MTLRTVVLTLNRPAAAAAMASLIYAIATAASVWRLAATVPIAP